VIYTTPARTEEAIISTIPYQYKEFQDVFKKKKIIFYHNIVLIAMLRYAMLLIFKKVLNHGLASLLYKNKMNPSIYAKGVECDFFFWLFNFDVRIAIKFVKQLELVVVSIASQTW